MVMEHWKSSELEPPRIVGRPLCPVTETAKTQLDDVSAEGNKA